MADHRSPRKPLGWAARTLQRYAEAEMANPAVRVPQIMRIESVGIKLDSRMVHEAVGRPLDDEIHTRDAPLAVRHCARILFRHASLLAHQLNAYTAWQVQLFALLRDNLTVSYRLVKTRRTRLFMMGMQVSALPEEVALQDLEIIFRTVAQAAGLVFTDTVDLVRFTVQYDRTLPPEENPVAGLDKAETVQRMARSMTADATLATDDLIARMDELFAQSEAMHSADTTSLWGSDDGDGDDDAPEEPEDPALP